MGRITFLATFIFLYLLFGWDGVVCVCASVYRQHQEQPTNDNIDILKWLNTAIYDM